MKKILFVCAGIIALKLAIPAEAAIVVSSDWTVNTAIPDGSRGTLFFNGLWVGSTLTISSTDCSPINWTFIDEISFNVATVPEPSVLALLTVGLGCLALRLRRKGVAYF